MDKLEARIAKAVRLWPEWSPAERQLIEEIVEEVLARRPLGAATMLIERDEDDIAHIVGLSFGKDSTCMSLALQEREPRPYTFVCTPTGDELPDMVAHMIRIETMLGKPVVKLTNGSLATQIETQRMLPNCFARWCTRLLKLKPFGQFMELNAPCVAYVGLRADEDEREGTRPGGDSAPIGAATTQDFPFQRWGWGIDHIQAYLWKRGIVVPERTDCARCPYQKLGEWYNLWLNHPAIYASAEADELRWGHTFRTATRDTWPAGLKELRLLFEAGKIPERSLRMMEKRSGMCRACSL
jgi:3'-phosphoadenosine 5'-phosphosulfate sulfotransferase (PAPS reductase)/FAD synthetase